MSELTDLERQVLDFARTTWRYRGARNEAIRQQFDMTSIRYDQLLNALIDRPEALMYDPMLVKRLQRLRARRRNERAWVAVGRR